MQGSCQDVYQRLMDILDELKSGSELDVWYTKNNKDKHLFIVEGTYRGFHDNPFKPFAGFIDEFEPHETHFGSTSDGAHFRFIFNDEDLSGSSPEPIKSIDRVNHRGAETNTVKECTNCRRSLTGLPYPPMKFMYPAEDRFSEPIVETHNLCVTCSPGHYDDVVRGVDFFAIEDGRVSRVGFKERGDGFDPDEWIEWVSREELDNPYIQDTIDVIEDYGIV